MIPIIAFVGFSKTGKTTLIEKIIPYFKKEGYNVATIKHTVHHIAFPSDEKDTTRHFKAGAKVTTIMSDSGFLSFGYVKADELDLETILKFYKVLGINLVFVEGFKTKSFPKVVIANTENEIKAIPKTESIICVVSRKKLNVSWPVFEPEEIDKIVKCIKDEISRRKGG